MRVFTIPAVGAVPADADQGADRRPADRRVSRRARDPRALATATLYLPTRRACRLARDVFLDVLGAEAAILPRIVAIGDIDEDEIAFAEGGIGAPAEALDLPPALDGLERRLAARAADRSMGEQLKPGDPARRRWSSTARPRRWRSPTISRG